MKDGERCLQWALVDGVRVECLLIQGHGGMHSYPKEKPCGHVVIHLYPDEDYVKCAHCPKEWR